MSDAPRVEGQGSPRAEADAFSLTFIVPTFNRHGSLLRLLASLRREAARSSFQVIVVDDGSSDATRRLESDPLVTVLRQQNTGPAGARNNGAGAASSSFLAFVDDDCEVLAGYVDRARDEATRRGGLVFGGPAVPMEAPGREPTLAGRYLRATRQLQVPITDGMGRIICLPSANLVIRRDLFQEAGGFVNRITRAGGEDALLTRRLRALGYPGRFLHDLVVKHDVDISLGEMLRKFYNYGVGAAWTAHLLGIAPQAVGLLATNGGEVLQAPVSHARRLVAYTRYLQKKAWLDDLPPQQRIAVGSLAYAETVPAFLGGIVGGLSAGRAEEDPRIWLRRPGPLPRDPLEDSA